MAKRNKSRNASASAFGWSFQTSAGIYLFLDYLENAISIKMEGNREDIEITLENGSIVYAQAKSVLLASDESNNIPKLKEALVSLGECEEPIHKLIYITNRPNPLKSKYMNYYVNANNSFENFASEKDKKLIIDNVKMGFPLDKFKVISFKFFGDESEERYEKILEKIREFLEKAKISEKAKRLLTEWKDIFNENNSQKLEMSKSQIIFPIIIITIENQDLAEKYNKVCGLDLYDVTNSKYHDLIKSIPRESKFFIKVCGHYQIKYPQGGDNINDFVLNYWRDYIDDLSDIENDKDILESLIKILLISTLQKRFYINKIKEAANLK